MENRMPEPTRPRRAIAAMFNGPGPVYNLNSVTGYDKHCLSKRRLPAYSMAGKGQEFQEDCSPGPKYAIKPGFTRHGPSGAPNAAVTSRNDDMTQFMTPSPAAYKVNVGPTKISAPQYTMQGRTAPEELNLNPAPNAYSLPPTVGEKCVDKSSAPAYHIRSRPEDPPLPMIPGPGTYKTTAPSKYKKASPAYSMTARNELPGDQTLKPGPGAHRPEKVKAHLRAAPAHSFGIRHSEYSGNVISQPPDNFCN